MACKDCSHFEAQNNESGRCTRYPPKANLIMQQGLGGTAQPAVITIWPEVRAVDRCGEYAENTDKPSNDLKSGLKLV